MSVRSRPRFIPLTAAGLALALALAAAAQAQAPVSAQGAVGAALGPPSQPKVVAPPAPPTVKPGEGGLNLDAAAALDAAVAAGDMGAALRAGATPADIVKMAKAKGIQGPLVTADPNLAAFVRAPNGAFALGYSGPGSYFIFIGPGFAGYAPPGGLDSLPTMADAFGPPPPPPALVAVGQLIAGGSSAQDAARALMSAQPLNSPLYNLDLSTARYVQGPNGGVGLGLSSSDGTMATVTPIPGAEALPGAASLPTPAQAYPRATNLPH